MADVLIDTGFLVALLSRQDQYHSWAVAQVRSNPHPWRTCEAALSEAFHLLEDCGGAPQICALLERGIVTLDFHLDDDLATVFSMMKKYSDVPMSLADGCLVRMTETLDDPVLLTTDADFRVYRRLGRKMIPARMPDMTR
jgi:predicted nucleic acid-binding protein